MSRIPFCCVLLLTGVLASSGAVWADLKGFQQELNSAYTGHNLYLRGFIRGTDLHYDRDGNLEGRGSPSDWTVDGIVRIDQLSLRRNKLQIEGRRMLQVYGVAAHGSQLLKGSRVRIAADLGGGDVNAVAVQGLMRRIFLTPEEPLAGQVPAYWRPYLEGKVRPSNKPAPAPAFELDGGLPVVTPGQAVPLEVGNDVSPPVPIRAPDPEYTDEARAAGCKGRLALMVVVGTDGAVQYVAIVRPLGLGLDDAAARAILGWKFKPAMRKGAPVAAKVVVEVSFSI